MKYNELQVSANKDKIRVGRGISAGRGKTDVYKRQALSQGIFRSRLLQKHRTKRLQLQRLLKFHALCAYLRDCHQL